MLIAAKYILLAVW